jgi:hypothetical protein
MKSTLEKVVAVFLVVWVVDLLAVFVYYVGYRGWWLGRISLEQ